MTAGHPFSFGPSGGRFGRWWNVAALALAVALAPSLAGAAEPGPATFMGQKIKPMKGDYLVLKDANVRAEPKTKSKKLGSVEAGAKIHVVGQAAGAWVAAVDDDGKPLGFVYDQILMPLIDGAVKTKITGRVQPKNGPECAYIIRFEGKSPVEGQDFEIADYDIVWKCKGAKGEFKFRTPMFITEAPYQLNSKPVYQITVDMIDLAIGYDEILSTNVLYDRDEAKVTYDSVSAEKYGKAPDTKSAPAKDVAEALDAAVRIAVTTWNDAAWADLAKIRENP